MDDIRRTVDDASPTTVVAEIGFDEEGMGRVEDFGTYSPSVQQYLAASSLGIPIRSGRNAGPDLMTASVSMTNGGGTGNGMLDPVIQAMMLVSEYYTIVNGDLWQLANVPLELGFHDNLQLTGDKGAITASRQFLDEINYRKRTEEIWLARYIYGQAYPILLTEGKNISGIIVPNSKHIAVSYQAGIGARQVAYAPPQDTIDQIGNLSVTPSFILRPTGTSWNEPVGSALPSGFIINPENVSVIGIPKLANNVYSIPPFVRAMAQIDARSDLEEMAQATIKGFRNQLWVFLVDKPRKGEIQALRRELSSDARTGVFVWGSNIKVEQHAPKTLDELLGNESYWRYTMAVYRALGISPRLVAGESPNIRSSSGDSETDVSVYLDRLIYSREPFREFTQSLLNRAIGKKAPRVDFPDIELKIASRIKGILTPLMNFGLPSPRTAFQKAGLDPDAEMKQHEEDWEFRNKYLHSYTGFSQAGPSGVTDSPSGGRPPGASDTEPRQSSEASLSGYRQRVLAEFGKLMQSPDEQHVRAFALRLYAAGAAFREEAYRSGYVGSGGRGTPSADNIEAWIAWDEGNLDGFVDDMVSTVRAGGDMKSHRNRAMMYPEMGYRMAFVAGVFQARSEQGYTGWQRVLNMNGSQSGPCPVCVADSKTIHPIEEPFFDHPNGVCGMRALRFYKGSIPGGPTMLPVVSLFDDLLV